MQIDLVGPLLQAIAAVPGFIVGMIQAHLTEWTWIGIGAGTLLLLSLLGPRARRR